MGEQNLNMAEIIFSRPNMTFPDMQFGSAWNQQVFGQRRPRERSL